MIALRIVAVLSLAFSLTLVDARLNHPKTSRSSPNSLFADIGKQPQYCDLPVAKQRVVFPNNITGRAKVDDVPMWSGYVNVTPTQFLFYWLFETRDHAPDAPLIIWTNGGPGCTSMEGATTELGPMVLFDVKEACSSAQCDYTLQMSTNPYSWNAHANVLFLDQPRTVGYSFGTAGPIVHSSVDAAKDFITFYQNFLGLFPEFVGRPLIIGGESYGGHYIPAFAGAILDYNAVAPDSAKINFAGAAIGNGCINWTVQNDNTYIEFQRQEKLLPTDANPTTRVQSDPIMTQYLGYETNFYDYRLQNIECVGCYGYNYSSWASWFLRPEIKQALGVCGDAGNTAFSGAAGGCVDLGPFDNGDTFDYSHALARTLEAGISVTMYYGMADTACDYVGGRAVAETLVWRGADAFRNTSMSPIGLYPGVDAAAGLPGIGAMKSSGGLTYIQVEAAGHMVPLDQPVMSYMAIETILKTLRAPTVAPTATSTPTRTPTTTPAAADAGSSSSSTVIALGSAAGVAVVAAAAAWWIFRDRSTGVDASKPLLETARV